MKASKLLNRPGNFQRLQSNTPNHTITTNITFLQSYFYCLGQNCYVVFHFNEQTTLQIKIWNVFCSQPQNVYKWCVCDMCRQMHVQVYIYMCVWVRGHWALLQQLVTMSVDKGSLIGLGLSNLPSSAKQQVYFCPPALREQFCTSENFRGLNARSHACKEALY